MDATAWRRLSGQLIAPDARSRAGDARVGATLALLADRGGGGEIVYTRRCAQLRTHPGQISFPGGRVEDGESVTDAALREASEEIGLARSSVRPLGALPAFYVPPSRFWLQTVVARWAHPHPLRRAEDEVAEILRVPLAHLTEPSNLRAVRLSARGWSWAWRLDGDHLLWGATAVATAALLDRLRPGWDGGLQPADLGPEREVEPWRGARRPPRSGGLLDGLPPAGSHVQGAGWQGAPGPRALSAVARGVAAAVERVGGEEGPVLVLAGAGGNGRAGLASARALAEAGWPVLVCAAADRGGRADPRPEGGLDGLTEVRLREGDLPPAGVVVDALVGGGLRGALSGPVREIVHALQRRRAKIVAVDLPSGLDAVEGLVGDAVAADVTVALGGARPAHVAPGVDPFVGDVAVVDEGGALHRLAPAAAALAGWRE